MTKKEAFEAKDKHAVVLTDSGNEAYVIGLEFNRAVIALRQGGTVIKKSYTRLELK